MSGNVIDIKTRRERDIGDREERLQKIHSQRLSGAPDIASRLRATSKIELKDRAIFARNLHRMCEEAAPRGGASTLRGIFEIAFGDDFDAKYKKRKRFVCSDDEDEPSEGFAAHGADFTRLAEAVVKVARKGSPADAITQAMNRATLQLVAGSSFDDQRPPEARLKDEAVATLLDCFDRMVRKVEAEVDLETMRAIIGHEAVSAVIGMDGTVERLETPKGDDDWGIEDIQTLSAARHIGSCRKNEKQVRIWESDLNDPDNPELSASEAYAPFAPRVVLREIFTPEELSAVAVLEIDEVNIERDVEKSAQDYYSAIERHALSDVTPPFNRDRARRDLLATAAAKAFAARCGYLGSWISEECNSFDDVEARIEEDDYECPEDPWTDQTRYSVVYRRQIELKLLRDYTTGRWRLCLALARGVPNFYHDSEGVYGIKKYTQPFEPSISLGITNLLADAGGMQIFFLHRKEKNCFILYGIKDEDYPREEVFGIGVGWLPIPSEPALDALLTHIEGSRIADHWIDPPIDIYWNKPAPAKSGTLAGMILRNLAYAPDEERYDLLLLEDAKAKAKMAQEFAKDRRNEFDVAIQRMKE